MNKLIIILLICLFYRECDSRWKEILNENDFVEYVEVDTVKNKFYNLYLEYEKLQKTTAKWKFEYKILW